jgi:hypothetical protein
MVLLHTLHNVANNEKYSQNSNEAYLINEMKKAECILEVNNLNLKQH